MKRLGIRGTPTRPVVEHELHGSVCFTFYSLGTYYTDIPIVFRYHSTIYLCNVWPEMPPISIFRAALTYLSILYIYLYIINNIVFRRKIVNNK